MENLNATVEILKNPDELWQLENAFFMAVGENEMTLKNFHRLVDAVETEKIIFFGARKNGEVIGMCSVSPNFSTFACKTCGVFDDFFIDPEHRGHGVAPMLVNAAREWCKQRDYASLTVGCSRGDAAMYQSLGFDTELGVLLAANL